MAQDNGKYTALGDLARRTWDLYGGRSLGAHTHYERQAFEEVAKAVLKSAASEGVTWSDGDDD